MMRRIFILSRNLLTVLVLFMFFASPVCSQNKIIGSKQCSDSNCHSKIFDHHQKHPHETFFNTRYEEDGLKIAKKMGIEDHFEDEKCITCHGTEVASEYTNITEEEKGLFGIICETCHNPAEDWVEIHDKKGKISQAVSKGMRPTRNLYQWSVDCFNCHRGVGESYFKAGHKMGDKFDLTKYSQGDFKHWDWSKADKEKGDLDKKLQVKLGKIWLVGEVFQIQYSLQRMADSAAESEFTRKNFALLTKSAQSLKKGSQTLPLENLNKILSLVDSVNPDPKSASKVLAEVKKLAKDYIHQIDQSASPPSDFSALPVPKEDSFIRIKKK
jgi:hypothetical protein